MALTNDDIRLAPERLHQAEKTRKQIRQISLEYPGITIADAYAIQKAWIEIKVAEGRVVKGHKIGLTSKAMQSALGIDEPDSGVLLDDMFFADGGLVPSDRFIGTRVEAELAFIMKQRLAGPDCTMFDVLNATDFVVPALEILDTRIERVDPVMKSTRKIFDTIADNAANAGIVLGGRPLRPLDADLRWIGALCYRNGELEETGLAAGVLNHPATSVAWLANKIAPNGLALEAGQVVLAGSFIRPIETRKGDTIQADYGPYGSMSCYFALCAQQNRVSKKNMPHFTIEYSANLDARVDMGKVVEVVRKAAIETSIFPLGGIRVRAVRCEHYAIADGNPNLAFLDMVLRLGEGRGLATRKKAGEHIFRALSDLLDPVFAQGQFALSFDMQINDKETSWKRNNIHEVLKAEIPKAESAHG